MTDEAPEVSFVFNAKICRLVDADTIECIVDRGFKDHSEMDIRIVRADAPENRAHERAAGEWVTKKLEEWLDGRVDVVIKSYKCKQSFTRYLFEVWCDGKNVSDWLLEQKYAWQTDDNGKVIGPRDVELLSIPEGIKQQVREALA